MRKTFLHIQGIGPRREYAIWRRGISSWKEALRVDLSWLGKRAERVRKGAEISELYLRIGEAGFFSQRLPPAERLRLWPEFGEDAAFLDIETDPFRITVVGLYFHGKYRVFVRGKDLWRFPQFLRQAKLVVTYNGSAFDLPVILRAFYGGKKPAEWPQPEIFNPPRGVHLPGKGHVDLKPILHARGIKGGLKASEEILGIRRPGEVAGLDGADAVLLWQRYEQGEEKALDLLIEYNRQDVVNLAKIIEILLQEQEEAAGRTGT